MPLPFLIRVDESSRVAEVRRHAITAARQQGMEDAQINEAGIVATEAATNLVKHARDGVIYISSLSELGHPGIEILSIDRGPGIADLNRCLADGYSSTGTPGTGLGAIARLSREFDVFSQPGRGTVFAARIYSKRAAPVPISAITVPFPGEKQCGDSWSVWHSGSETRVMIADGLGHGALAADASTAAVSVFQDSPETSPTAMLEAVHNALRGTRGAAVGIAFIQSERRRIRFAGVGNISGVVWGGPKPQHMVSHNGTAGHEARRFQEFEYDLPPNSVVVMHSDGLVTSWSFDSYPGLLFRRPSVIAGVLYRDATRSRDDSCVVVIKSEGA